VSGPKYAENPLLGWQAGGPPPAIYAACPMHLQAQSRTHYPYPYPLDTPPLHASSPRSTSEVTMREKGWTNEQHALPSGKPSRIVFSISETAPSPPHEGRGCWQSLKTAFWKIRHSGSGHTPINRPSLLHLSRQPLARHKSWHIHNGFASATGSTRF
jgi:hypothetical protein